MQYKVCSKEGEKFFYHGLIVTSIDHKDAPEKKGYEYSFSSMGDNNVVERLAYKYVNPILFSELTTGKESWLHRGDSEALEKHNEEFKYDAASFFYNVLEVSNEYDEVTKSIKYTYLADKITPEKAKEIFDKDRPGYIPFFAIHGFNSEARDHIEGSSRGNIEFVKKESKNVVIPIIWPSRGYAGARAYLIDRGEFVPEAAIELEKLMFAEQAKSLNAFPKKNLMCHSMGNYLLRKIANERIKFDNIFMVAADVRHNLFDKEYIARFDKTGPSRNPNADEGLNIIKMLQKGGNNKPIGKIYALTNWDDDALQLSTGLNYVNRLGQAGMGTYDKWIGGWGEDKELLHPYIRDHYENKDMLPNLRAENKKNEHGYQWMSFAMKYYIDKINETKN